LLLTIGSYLAGAWNPLPVKDDPALRMPGAQPDQNINLEGSGRCLNCHAGYNTAVEPGHNWKGSMMAQAARDPMWYACVTVAAQDSIWALGNPNATDLCIRCHSPAGWLGGRSDPTNMSALTGDDFDGLSCDFCHRVFDPFFEGTFSGAREGGDWTGYWDEASSLSQTMAQDTYNEDALLSQGILLFSGSPFYLNNEPKYSTYDENGGGQYFVSPSSQKRASFADAAARHQMFYSRYHKSKFFCSTCHDVSNPALANIGLSGLVDQSPTNDPALISEQYAAYRYFHVERTFSEFSLSDYGQQGGAPTNADFQAQGAPDVTHAAKCQDCHMRDVVGVACNKQGVPIRPTESTEHPNSGLPLHDLTGGNAWVSYILASLDANGPVYDPVNLQILDKGPAVLTLDLGAGQTPVNNGQALKDGSDRALQQLRLAATIKDLAYDAASGAISFKVQNNTGHRLISGFPEGRRMFVNIKLYAGGSVIQEVNPYSTTVGTMKGLPNSASSPALGVNEVYEDSLVYEVHPSSSLTGEHETFHFVLADGRWKDNRIPPRGYDIAGAAERHSEPVVDGAIDTTYFTSAEYAGGYDAVALDLKTGADAVEVTVYYQGTSREYIEFLRDEINGTGNLTLGAPLSGEPEAYVVQTDPFFSQLKAWGDTIWALWEHNHGLDGSGVQVAGIVPFAMTSATWGSGGGTTPPCSAPVPTLLSAIPGHTLVNLAWSDEHSADPAVTGYRIYYDQAGKSQLVDEVGLVTAYTDTGLTDGVEYCYKVTSITDCESGFSNILCATPSPRGVASVTSLITGRYETIGSGKNKTTQFVDTSSFVAGDEIVFRATLVDQNGLPVAGAGVDIGISGPEIQVLTATSDANGLAETPWRTSAPNRRGTGGTTPGAYEAVTTSVVANGYDWDGVQQTTPFSIQ